MRKSHRAFTIIELLVVVSIIALLVGILLPAIGRAREQAKLTSSQSNIKQIGTAAGIYTAEWADRQFTTIPDSFAIYGNDGTSAKAGYAAAHSGEWVSDFVLGSWAGGGTWFWVCGSACLQVPMDFDGGNQGFGAFRIPHNRNFSQYLTGRLYDPVWFAPKDVAAVTAIEPCEGYAGEWCPSFSGGPASGGPYPPSYAMSAAAMFTPEVMANPDKGGAGQGGWQDPYELRAGFRSPSTSQTLFPDLKTNFMEHSWLQNTDRDDRECNPQIVGGTYDGCEPFYFNHGYSSNPVTLFYDGHIEGVGQFDAILATKRQVAQVGWGLWSIDSPMGGGYDDGSDGGYFMDIGHDWTSTSHHILTTDGIRGRDVFGEN
jgi:prepilin-type N-terminal cleavage/methylation domain-containing protein